MRKLAALAALAATAVAALPAQAAAPGVAASARYPTALASDAGAVRLVAESDADAPVSGVQIFVSAGLDRETEATSGIAALVADCIVRTRVATRSLGMISVADAIAADGGSVTYTVDGRSVHYYIEGRSENLGGLVALFSKALAAPDFSPATVAAARASLSNRIAELQSSALNVGIEMFRRSYYSTSVGQPTLGSTATIAALSTRDLAAFYAQNYTRSAVAASAVGKLPPDLMPQVRALAAALPDRGPVAAVPQQVKTIPAEAPRIIANRDISAPWVVVGFAAPSPASPDFGAMLVLESLLSDAFERSSATTLGFVEKSVGAFYLYDSTPASLVVYVNGTQVDPSLALRELIRASRVLSTKPLDPGPLQHFKTAAEGQFLTDSVNLSDRSYLLGTFAAQGLGADAINTALDALDRTTAADVQRVAKTYLQRYIVALVLPRQSQ